MQPGVNTSWDSPPYCASVSRATQVRLECNITNSATSILIAKFQPIFPRGECCYPWTGRTPDASASFQGKSVIADTSPINARSRAVLRTNCIRAPLRMTGTRVVNVVLETDLWAVIVKPGGQCPTLANASDTPWNTCCGNLNIPTRLILKLWEVRAYC